jgi:hypothetical protein
MAINVTPIPKLTAMAAPAFTLGTANAAGDALTAVASNSTLLAFDAVAPAAVAAAAVVGTSTVTARRDHVHPGTTGAGTVVDEAITRFNGTGGSSLQGYSSLSPTISDAGIVSLTSGALKWPATVITSTEPNTLFDYEMGTWTPVLWDSSRSSSESQTYDKNAGTYLKIGRFVYYYFSIEVTSLGTLTATDAALVGGLPFPARNSSDASPSFSPEVRNMLLGTAGFNPTITPLDNRSDINVRLYDATGGTTNLLISEWGANGDMRAAGFYDVG